MKVKSMCTLILGLFLVSCTSEPAADLPVIPSEDEAKTAIMEKITKAAEGWSSGDPLAYVVSAAPGITWMDDLAAPIPVKGKEALKVYLEGFIGVVPHHKFELLNFHFQFLEDVVIVTYHYQGLIEEMDANPWKVTAVYRYMDGDWFSVHENWTVVESKEESAE